MVKDKEEKVKELARVFNRVCGLDENQAKTAIYYSMATHKLGKFTWFPALAFIGAPGTGKSKAIDTLEQLCFKPCRITCHATMSAPVLRDELDAAKGKTAIIEECDLYPNRKQLQSYLINRVDKTRTSGVIVKEIVETESGDKGYRSRKKQVFGATVMHDRRSLDDMAAESRAIVINTIFREGNFMEPPKRLALPTVKLADVPSFFTSGRVLDTWKPLIMVASGIGDDSWLHWLYFQIEEGRDQLRDGQVYEERLAIFSKVIEVCYNGGLDKLIVKESLPLKSVTEALKNEGLMYISPQVIKKILTSMGLKVRMYGGSNKLFTSEDELRKVAKEIGYKDEFLE